MDPAPPVRRAGALVGLEGAVLALVGIGYAAAGLLGHPVDRPATVLAGTVAGLAGLGLLVAGRALRLARNWPWSPAVIAQLFLLVVAVGVLQARIWAIGIPLLLLCGAVLYQLATPEARAGYRAGR